VTCPKGKKSSLLVAIKREMKAWQKEHPEAQIFSPSLPTESDGTEHEEL
jgi:hypothetical protein